MENTPNFINTSYLVQVLCNIIDMEKEIENMVKDNVLDIFVDCEGTFSYQITDEYYKQLCGIDNTIQRKNSTFKTMCMNRGIDERIYDEYQKTKVR